MDSRILACFALLFASCVYSTRITLKENGYEGIVIAINPQVKEDPGLIDALKSAWTSASQYLFVATRNRAYFRNITILVPGSWTEGNYDKSSRGESYTSADVLVAKSNPIFRDIPYTVQYGECGKPGQYIHITPDYIRLDELEFDTGIRGKVIVHEWAHLRWGVFDEGPVEGYPAFYLARGSVGATRCPAAIRGLNLQIDFERSQTSSCSLNQTTLLPEPGCFFAPYAAQTTGVNASLMSHQFLTPVTGFCHSDPSDPLNRHNTAAPSEHNRLCNLRSVWDVMMDSDDFANGTNPSNFNILDTTPTFSVVQTPANRYVLVMDVSGSMGGIPLLTMQRAAGLFVSQYVSAGSYVGLVEFENRATNLSSLQEINDESRGNLESIIKSTSAGGGTGIGLGILTGLNVLAESGYGGGTLIVLTDGEETTSPFVEDVYDDVINSGAQMYTVFLDLSASSVNKIMTDLSKASGGDWFITSSSASNSDIIGLFQQLAQSNDGDTLSKTYQIQRESFTIPSRLSEKGSAKIDTSVGNQTLFSFTYENVQPKILLQSPAGCVYATYANSSLNFCSDNPIHDTDTSVRLITFSVPGTAQTGEWIYFITNANRNPWGEETFSVTVTSKPSNSLVEPIEIVSILSVSDITSATATVLYAKVTQGFNPVLDANVTAFVTPPSGPTVISQLFDNGAGPDVRRNDGIYSRYFYRFTSQGRYSVQIKVGKQSSQTQRGTGGSPAAFSPGTLFENGTFVANPNGLKNLPNNTVQRTSLADDFERVESGGSISYTGPTISETSDLFPPNKVTDLEGNQLNVTNLEDGDILVLITFTAPGDDLDTGNASSYEVRYSFGTPSPLIARFNESRSVNTEDIAKGALDSPLPAGSEENIVFKISKETDDDASQLFVALRAYDDTGKRSDVSNVDEMTLFFSKSALPTISTMTPTTEYVTDTTKAEEETTNNKAEEQTTSNKAASSSCVFLPITLLPVFFVGWCWL